jgi:hypothetical protein
MYSLRADLNIVKYVFTDFTVFVQFPGPIFKPLVGLMHMIYRWKTVKIAQLFCQDYFSKKFTVLN